ncbi:MAG TPA: dihydropteroate synthase [Ramlibacter sp.]|nr:dihydropteroate synthase [Ramlibacter sp.]
MHWQTARYRIDLTRPKVMAIVNVTPDSFSDGGRFASTQHALAHCEELLVQGAHILDIGGESSRPGTPPVSVEEERARVMPVLREAVNLGVPISVDTCKPEIMREALDLGADIINDIWGLRRDGAVEAIVGHPHAGVCIMHMHGEPASMQRDPMPERPADAVPKVRAFLEYQTQALLVRGFGAARIAWDPGIGFGKTPEQNFALLARQRDLVAGHPLVIGWSRKSSLGSATGLPVTERIGPSLAAAVLAVERGANVVRVHDVKETVAALNVVNAMESQQ